MKSVNFSETINPAAAFRHTAVEKSLSFPHSYLNDVPKSLKKMVAGNIQIDHSSSSQPNLNEMMQAMVEKYI